MYKDLKHLSVHEIENLMNRYYSGVSVEKLLKEYDLSIRAPKLYLEFPPETINDCECEFCNSLMVVDRKSKSSNIPRNKSDIYCPVCGHKLFDVHCNCKNCDQKKTNIKNMRIDQIKKCYTKPQIPVEFDSLSFENKVYIGTLCRALLDENLYDILPYMNTSVPMAPSKDFVEEIYITLFHVNAIKVSPKSSIEAFDVEYKDFPNSFYIFDVTYYLNLCFPFDKNDLFTKIFNPDYYSQDVSEEAYALWLKIAVGECIEYLEYQLKNVGFSFTAGEKTHKTFEIILNDFSVSQIYGIIWRAVADASKLYLEKRFSKLHAANSVIGACERYAQRAKINKWTLNGYNRLIDLPQSTISEFFFNRVLKIGDMGFQVPPTIV